MKLEFTFPSVSLKEKKGAKDLFISYRNKGKASKCLFFSLFLGHCNCIMTFFTLYY